MGEKRQGQCAENSKSIMLMLHPPPWAVTATAFQRVQSAKRAKKSNSVMERCNKHCLYQVIKVSTLLSHISGMYHDML